MWNINIYKITYLLLKHLKLRFFLICAIITKTQCFQWGYTRVYGVYPPLRAGYTLKKNVYAPCAFKDFGKADSFGAIFCVQKMKTYTQEVFLATNDLELTSY